MVYKIVNGAVPSGTEWMSNSVVALRQSGRNLIRQMEEYNFGGFPDDGMEWATAYINSSGRFGNVDSTRTAYSDNSESYFALREAGNTDFTTINSAGTTTPESAFNNNLGSGASLNNTNDYLGKDFGTSKNIRKVTINWRAATGTYTYGFDLEYYNGTSWVNIGSTSGNSTSPVNYSVDVDVNAEQVRIVNTSGGVSDDIVVYAMLIGLDDNSVDYVIPHNLPAGSFSDTISSAFFTTLISGWEDGANIQFKLTNGVDDSGWLDYNEIQSFTAFASGEPDELIVKLIPKTTSPTLGYPSIKGVAIFE